MSKLKYHETQLYRIWCYLWKTYKENGGVPKHISDAISLIQERLLQ